MPDKPISALPAASAVTADDLFAMVNDPAGAAQTQRATAQQIKNFVGDVAAEAATRSAADTVLQGNIDSEAAARIAADAVLQGEIDGISGGTALVGDQYRVVAGIAAGAQSITVDPANNGIKLGGFLIIAPYTPTCQVRQVSSVVGNVIGTNWLGQGTVGSEAPCGPLLARKMEFIASTKKIRLRRTITAIASTAAASVTADSSTDTITYNSHGLSNGDVVRFGGTAPTGLNTSSWYYVVSAAANTFQVSLTRGGSAINFSDNGASVTVRKAMTVTTATAHQYSAGNGAAVTNGDFVEITGTTNFNGIAWVATVPSSTTMTVIFDFPSGVPATSESAGFIQLDACNGGFNSLYVGQTIAISGSSSNNGIFTIASITLDGGEMVVNETVVDENAGSATSIFDRLGVQSANVRVVYVAAFPEGQIPLTLFGVGPRQTDNATEAAANSKAFNAANRMAFYGNLVGLLGVFIPSGNWFFGTPIRPESGTFMYGAGVNGTIIKPSTAASFPFDTTGDVALIMPVRQGLPCRFTMDGATGRWYLGNFRLDCNNMTNGNGIVCSAQQPCVWRPIQVYNCTGLYGVYFGIMQQIQIEYLQTNGCKFALRLGSASFVYIDTLNTEGTLHLGHSVLLEGQRQRSMGDVAANNGGGYQLVINNWHCEETSGLTVGDSAFHVDSAVTAEFHVTNLEISANGITMFKFARVDSPCFGSIQNVYFASGSAGLIMIDDAYRNLSLDAITFFGRFWKGYYFGPDFAQAAGNPASPSEGGYSISIPSAEGAMTRLGLTGFPDASTNKAALIRLSTTAAGRRLIAGFGSGSATVPVWTVDNEGIAMFLGSVQADSLSISPTGQTIEVYTATPEGALDRPRGSMVVNKNGGTNTTFYIKETASGSNTGWAALSNAGSIIAAVILAPASDTRNQIIPSGADHVALSLKRRDAGDVKSLLEALDTDDTVLFCVKPYSGGRVGIGTSGPGFLCDVNGNFNAVSYYQNGEQIMSPSGGYLDLAGGYGSNPGSVRAQRFIVDVTTASNAGIVVTGFTSQSADLVTLKDVAAAVLSRFNKDGYFITKKNSAPADVDLNAGEMAIWFDPTNGAAKLMIKAKETGGTVRTGSISLS